MPLTHTGHVGNGPTLLGCRAEACPRSLTVGRAPGTGISLAAPSPAVLPYPISTRRSLGVSQTQGPAVEAKSRHTLVHILCSVRGRVRRVGSDVSCTET